MYYTIQFTQHLPITSKTLAVWEKRFASKMPFKVETPIFGRQLLSIIAAEYAGRMPFTVGYTEVG